ncbi:MAG: hypothetical protein AB1490_05345 [Pseudomonadota bacterium]
MTNDWKTLGGVTRDDAPEQPQYWQEDHQGSVVGHPGRTRYRMFDWSRAIGLPVFWLILSIPIIPLSVSMGVNRIVALIVWLLVFIALLRAHFGGIIFDLEKDRLTYPVLLLRRTIRLSEIQDANAEYIHRSFKVDALDTPVNPKSEKETVRMPIYAANLSGDFGVRQVKFWSKKRRDQFLSHLRETVPGVRITRWW